MAAAEVATAEEVATVAARGDGSGEGRRRRRPRHAPMQAILATAAEVAAVEDGTTARRRTPVRPGRHQIMWVVRNWRRGSLEQYDPGGSREDRRRISLAVSVWPYRLETSH